jgi:16S rRNA (guanine527-N7)-methyltransferase
LALPRISHQWLVSGARVLGVSLDTCMIEVFEGFLEELTKWNQRMNLTALRDDRSIIVRHFLDSLTLVRHLPKGSSVLDIGSGAGFPGIPLGIVRSDLEIVLLEASRKKTYFHRKVIRSLNLSGIESIWGRSDQAEIKAELGGRFDVVVSRAVMPLESFLQEATDFVRPEGMIVVMGGENVDVPCLPPSLDLHLDNTVSLDLPFDRTRRHLLFFRK